MPDTPEQNQSSPETVLAFDFGLRRIGIAVGQTVSRSATPLGVVANRDRGPDMAAIGRLIGEWQPRRLVVGVPAREGGLASAMDAPVQEFIAALGRFGLPVATVDERNTSLEAEERLKSARAAGQRGRISKEDIDATAAVLIAERYLACGIDNSHPR